MDHSYISDEVGWHIEIAPVDELHLSIHQLYLACIIGAELFE
jgi:hypothetical protein